MKEFIYSLKCLIQKKEFYFAIIGILLINLIHVFLVIHYNLNTLFETGYRAEYLYILYNPSVNLNMIIIIVFPILCSTIFSDINFIEKRQKTNMFLYTRLNQKKLIFSRFIIIIFTVFLINFLSFLLNYISLYFIYGSGNALSYFQNSAFYMVSKKFLFMDSLRLSNLPLFLICVIAHVSFILSLLSGLAYSISFFVKQKIIIYVFPFFIMLFTEFVCPLLNLSQYSIVGQLQPLSVFKVNDSIILYFILLLVSIILLRFSQQKKDLL
jgi:hypothetical protein